MPEVEVRFARALQSQARLPASCTARAATARQAVRAVAAHYPQLERFILDDQRRVRQHVNIFINDTQIRDRIELSDPLHEGDQLHILPAVSGGAHSAIPTPTPVIPATTSAIPTLISVIPATTSVIPATTPVIPALAAGISPRNLRPLFPSFPPPSGNLPRTTSSPPFRHSHSTRE